MLKVGYIIKALHTHSHTHKKKQTLANTLIYIYNSSFVD